MILCIAGDRECTDYSFLLDAINKCGFTNITEVVHGDARGADKLGEQWGKSQGLFVKSFPADWKNVSSPNAKVKLNAYGEPYNCLAGFERNEQMAKYADCFIILQPDGDTAGSSDMKKQAEKLNKPVYVHRKTTEGEYKYTF